MQLGCTLYLSLLQFYNSIVSVCCVCTTWLFSIQMDYGVSNVPCVLQMALFLFSPCERSLLCPLSDGLPDCTGCASLLAVPGREAWLLGKHAGLLSHSGVCFHVLKPRILDVLWRRCDIIT